MPAVLWADGRTQRAGSWQGLLDAVRELPWNRHMDEGKLRHVMARRAFVWSGIYVDTYGPPRVLFQELARAGILRVIPEPQEQHLRVMLETKGRP